MTGTGPELAVPSGVQGAFCGSGFPILPGGVRVKEADREFLVRLLEALGLRAHHGAGNALSQEEKKQVSEFVAAWITQENMGEKDGLTAGLGDGPVHGPDQEERVGSAPLAQGLRPLAVPGPEPPGPGTGVPWVHSLAENLPGIVPIDSTGGSWALSVGKGEQVVDVKGEVAEGRTMTNPVARLGFPGGSLQAVVSPGLSPEKTARTEPVGAGGNGFDSQSGGRSPETRVQFRRAAEVPQHRVPAGSQEEGLWGDSPGPVGTGVRDIEGAAAGRKNGDPRPGFELGRNHSGVPNADRWPRLGAAPQATAGEGSAGRDGADPMRDGHRDHFHPAPGRKGTGVNLWASDGVPGPGWKRGEGGGHPGGSHRLQGPAEWPFLMGDARGAQAVDRAGANPGPGSAGGAATGPPTLLREMITRAELFRSGKTTEMRLHLKPGYLGDLNLHLVARGEDLLARLLVGNSEVRDLVQANLFQLRQSLASQGLDGLQFTVALYREGHQGAGSGWGNGRGGRKQDRAVAPAEHGSEPGGFEMDSTRLCDYLV